MKETIKYVPYCNWKEFKILKQDEKRYFVFHNSLLEINKEGYIPKAGLLFEEILKEKCKEKKILDLGCGPLGILGMIALFYGAKEVLSVDIDDSCIRWLNYIIKENNLSGIKTMNSNLFEKIDQSEKFDVILSNPPHMPMLKGKLCDSGGIDGKKYIYQILKDGYNYLNDNGELNIMMFDFLGVKESYNDDISISEYSKNIGYKDCEIIFEIDKFITEGSVTYDCLNYIKKIYPNYFFDIDNPKCKIIIVKFKK